MPEATPGALARALRRLAVRIDDVSTEVGAVPVVGYYEGAPRPTGVVRIRGDDLLGEGENVDWTPVDQIRFEAFAQGAIRTGDTTVGAVSDAMPRDASPYHRAALESAVVDLALQQNRSNLFRLAERDPTPVSFCWSIGSDALAGRDPDVVIDSILAAEPGARFKLDVDDGWTDGVLERLAATRRIVVLDFKRRSEPEATRSIAARFPDAWIEDPVLTGTGAPLDADRIALDGYVSSAEDLDPPPASIGAVNVKPARVGGPLEALACLERCRVEGWHAYFGGMFEIGIGRAQSRVLASLFTSRAWNDLAPLRRTERAPYPESPLEIEGDVTGYGRASA